MPPELGYFISKSNNGDSSHAVTMSLAEFRDLLRQDGLFTQANFAKMLVSNSDKSQKNNTATAATKD